MTFNLFSFFFFGNDRTLTRPTLSYVGGESWGTTTFFRVYFLFCNSNADNCTVNVARRPFGSAARARVVDRADRAWTPTKITITAHADARVSGKINMFCDGGVEEDREGKRDETRAFLRVAGVVPERERLHSFLISINRARTALPAEAY